jgi:hypothetical protein
LQFYGKIEKLQNNTQKQTIHLQDPKGADIHNINKIDMELSGDSAFHIANAIISSRLKLEDRLIFSNEQNHTNQSVETLIQDKSDAYFSNLGISTEYISKPLIDMVPLLLIPDALDITDCAIKRIVAVFLANQCDSAYNATKDNKDIKNCVSDIVDALKTYELNATTENANSIKEKQIKLKEVLDGKFFGAYAKDVLAKIFTRVAIDNFLKDFSGSHKTETQHHVRLFFNKLHSDLSASEINLDQETILKYPEYKNNLIYGFGFYPSSVDSELKTLNNNTSDAESALQLLKAASKCYPVISRSKEEKFEALNTGTTDDGNCAFRAISVGAGHGTDGYNFIQQNAIKGAEEVLKLCKKGQVNDTILLNISIFAWKRNINPEKRKQEYLAASNEHLEEGENGNLRKLAQDDLESYVNLRKNDGFVSGCQSLEYFLAAIGSGHPICCISYIADTIKEETFFPDGTTSDSILESYNTEPIYIAEIRNHSEALLPIDDDKMCGSISPQTKQKIEDTISEFIFNNIENNILKTNNIGTLLYNNIPDALSKEASSKEHINLRLTSNMIKAIKQKANENERNEIEQLEQKLSEFMKTRIDDILIQQFNRLMLMESSNTEMNDHNNTNKTEMEAALSEYAKKISEKAVEICQKEPLFWDDFENRQDYLFI